MELHARRMDHDGGSEVNDDGVDTALTADDWRAHLRKRGLLGDADEPAVVALAGGVSAQVVRIGDLVAKRPYRRLQVESAWIADLDRVAAEARALHEFDAIAPPLVDFDEHRNILVQRFVPGSAWKADLLAGRCDIEVARGLGAIASHLHSVPTDQFDDGAARFAQLRIDPYFETAAASFSPCGVRLRDLAERLREPGCAVVHGDLSPKNILVDSTVHPPRLTVIDWEVVHIGVPEFDLAFLVTHLRAKAAHLPDRAADLGRLERAFLEEYTRPFDEALYRALLGGLLIARVHGRSPLPYLGPEAASALVEEGVALLDP